MAVPEFFCIFEALNKKEDYVRERYEYLSVDEHGRAYR